MAYENLHQPGLTCSEQDRTREHGRRESRGAPATFSSGYVRDPREAEFGHIFPRSVCLQARKNYLRKRLLAEAEEGLVDDRNPRWLDESVQRAIEREDKLQRNDQVLRLLTEKKITPGSQKKSTRLFTNETAGPSEVKLGEQNILPVRWNLPSTSRFDNPLQPSELVP